MVPLLLLAALAAPLDLDHLDDGAWIPVATRDTPVGVIAVHRQPLRGVDCWQATLTAPVGPATLLEVATDLEGAERWTAAHLASSHVLERGPGWLIYAQHMDTPEWTLTRDRFWVLRGEVSAAGAGGWRMRWTRLEAAQRAPELYARWAVDAVEVAVNEGEWLFLPDGEGARVRYRVCTDPGGRLADWVARLATRKTLPDNVASVVAEARRRAAAR